MTAALVVCRGVEVVYHRGGEAVHALAGVDLTVERHDSLALLGRSGSGKTTLLHVLGGLVKPTAGQVERPARGIAYVFQGSNLLPHFTSIENVALRALAPEPQLLLCDEPTGHLDTDTGERVLDLIDALQRELGFALVVATHDADIARRLRRSVELHDGRMVAEVVA